MLTVNGAEVALKSLLERAICKLTSAGRSGREVLPEERVVNVTWRAGCTQHSRQI